MTRSRPLVPILLAAVVTWIAVVVVDHARASGLWAATVRNAVVLVGLTALLATTAAVMDDWIDQLLRRR